MLKLICRLLTSRRVTRAAPEVTQNAPRMAALPHEAEFARKVIASRTERVRPMTSSEDKLLERSVSSGGS